MWYPAYIGGLTCGVMGFIVFILMPACFFCFLVLKMFDLQYLWKLEKIGLKIAVDNGLGIVRKTTLKYETLLF